MCVTSRAGHAVTACLNTGRQRQCGILFCMRLRVGVVIASLAAAVLGWSQQPSPPPAWPASAVVEPAAFAAVLQSSAKPPVILCVAPAALYKAKHLPHAISTGAASRPEGLAALAKAVEAMPKDAEIVVYCGCCPLAFCPNLRPAYKALTELGYTNVRVLHIPTNMNTDWYSKNYPTETTAPAAAPK